MLLCQRLSYEYNYEYNGTSIWLYQTYNRNYDFGFNMSNAIEYKIEIYVST